MWFWKKRKIEHTDEKSPAAHPDAPPEPEPEGLVLMGDVAVEPDGNEDGEEGTSRAAYAVSARMEHLNSPRAAGSFDPSKANPSTLISLQSVKIATPCRADWSKMEGDAKSRFCQTCQKSVYNLSAMTAPEAQALLAEKQGDLCARLYRRADGTVITQDCPVGKTTPRRPFWGAALAAIFSALVSGCGSNAARSSGSSGSAGMMDSMRNVPILGALLSRISPAVMGAIAVAPPTTGKVACPVPTSTPVPSEKPAPAPTPKPHVEPMMGAVAYPVMGRISRPRPTAAPKPTARATPTNEPDGTPEMGEAAPSGS